MKARKQNSPESIRKRAKDHHLPELLDMESELEQLQPVVLQRLAERGASIQEILEVLTPRYNPSGERGVT